MICPACQFSNAPGASRCARCGRVLQDAEATIVPAARAVGRAGPAAAAPALAVSDSNPSETILSATPHLQDPDATLVSPPPISSHDPDATLISPAPRAADPNATLIAGSPRSGSIAARTGIGQTSVPPTPAGYSQRTAAPLPDFGPRYEVLSVLGQGGMGAVYKARDLELDRLVALKLLRPELVPDAAAIQRFKQELLLASKVSHRNILRIHDLGDANGVKFISMAYIEGQDLHRVIQQEKRLPLPRALNFARQILEALEAAHAEGVIHRDLKPQNIMVDGNDHLYVMDFGLAKSTEADTHMTMTGQVVGTPQYMAPEQVEGGPIDRRADLYAFGLILDEMLTGELVFRADSAFHLMLMRIREAPRRPREVVPDIPEYVERIIMRCLMRSPEERYQSAREILNDLSAESAEAVREQETLALTSPRLTAAGQSKSRAPKITFAALAAGAVLALTIVSVPALRTRVLPNFGARATTATPVAATEHVAVLPLQIVGNDSRLALIATGIQQALNGKLAAAHQLTLADSAQVEKIDQNKPPERIAAQLGANLLVQGSLQGTSDKFRIALTLVDLRSGVKKVALQPIDSTAGDLLRAEDSVYDVVSNSLSLNLSTDEQASAQARVTQSNEAYDAYLEGRNAMRGQADLKNVTKAIRYFEEATQKDNTFALAYAGLADAYMRIYQEKKDPGAASRAAAAAQQAAGLDPDFRTPQVHFTVGDIYVATGNTALGLSELRKAVQRAPNVDEGYRRLGHAYLAAKKPNEAIDAFKQAIQINPYYWMNHNELAAAYYHQGDFADAMKEWTEVTRLDSENVAGLNNLGAVQFQMGEFSKAVATYQASLKLAPSRIGYSNLGTAYFYVGDFKNAVANFRKAVEFAPDSALNVYNLADGLRLDGETAEAAALYDKAIGLALRQLRVNPNDTFTRGFLAACYAKKGDAESAEREINTALKTSSDDPDQLYTKALVEAYLHHNDAALDALQQSLDKGEQPSIPQAEPDLAALRALPRYKAMIAKATQSSPK